MSRRYTFFMHLRSLPDWLKLGRGQRQRFLAEHVRPVVDRYSAVTLRFYDAEAFSGRCTDIAVFETDDLQAYTFLVDGLRDTAFFSHPYFEVLDIVPAVEDGYVEYDRAHGVAAA
jgi:hypothetical protein